MSQSNHLIERRIPPQGLFITGSDTHVGKTQVAVTVIEELKKRGVCVGAYKPVASGMASLEDPTSDVFRLWQAIDKRVPIEQVGPQCFLAPLAPSLAAIQEGKRVDEERLVADAARWFDDCDFLVVEGAGGLLSPLSPHRNNADLAMELRYPVLVVVENRLGAVNQALMTFSACLQNRLSVSAIILNDSRGPDLDAWNRHREMIVDWLQVIAKSAHSSSISPPVIHHAFERNQFSEELDWCQLGNSRGMGLTGADSDDYSEWSE